MKKWIIVDYVKKKTVGICGETIEEWKPNLDGYEDKINITRHKIAYPGEVLLKISGMPSDIAFIILLPNVTTKSDDEAFSIIQTTNNELEDLDVLDFEIDEIAKSQGVDPQIRADIQIPTRGKQPLQDQENYLMTHICEKMEFTKAWWDKEAPNGKWATGVAIENDIKEGKGEAYEFTLSRMRMKHLKITCSCDKPNKIAHDITCIEVPDIPIIDRKELPLEAAQAQGYAPCPICKSLNHQTQNKRKTEHN